MAFFREAMNGYFLVYSRLKVSNDAIRLAQHVQLAVLSIKFGEGGEANMGVSANVNLLVLFRAIIQRDFCVLTNYVRC